MSDTPPEAPRFLVIGRISRPHGVRGEVRVVVHTEEPARFHWLDAVYLGDIADHAPPPRRVAVEGVRQHQGHVLLKLAGYDDRTAAEALRQLWVQVPLEEALPLEEGEYYLYQLLGLAVLSTDEKPLGTLADVIETGANNVFVVRGPRGELLLPDTEEVVRSIDFDAGRMIVELLPGLLTD